MKKVRKRSSADGLSASNLRSLEKYSEIALDTLARNLDLAFKAADAVTRHGDRRITKNAVSTRLGLSRTTIQNLCKKSGNFPTSKKAIRNPELRTLCTLAWVLRIPLPMLLMDPKSLRTILQRSWDSESVGRQYPELLSKVSDAASLGDVSQRALKISGITEQLFKQKSPNVERLGSVTTSSILINAAFPDEELPASPGGNTSRQSGLLLGLYLGNSLDEAFSVESE